MSDATGGQRPDLSAWGTEVWVGGVNPWNCDRMGHLNTRFYVAHMAEGLAVLAALLGLDRAFAPDAPATLRIHEQQIRFLKEARVGAALALRAGVLDIGGREAEIGILMLHDDGGVAASAVFHVSNVSAGDDAPVAWPERVRDRAADFIVALPSGAAPRGVPVFAPTEGPSLRTADALGFKRIGIGVFGPETCDLFGRMRPEQLIARVSDGITRLVEPLHHIVGEAAPEPVARPGGAVLEYRSIHHAWPRVGDLFELRSGLVAVEGKVLRLTHWMLDPRNEAVWATLDGVAVTLDLDRRRAVEISASARDALETHLARGAR